MGEGTFTAAVRALPLFEERARRRDLTVRDGDVSRFLDALAGRGWVRADRLTSEMGWNARYLRSLANASRGQVLGWRLGYALTREVGDDFADAVERRLLSQAKAMTERAVAIRRVRNGRMVA